MKTAADIRSVTEEAQFIKESKLDYGKAMIFAGEREGTEDELREIGALRRKLGKGFYVEMIYALTHKVIKDPEKAASLYRGIARHRKKFEKALDRDVGLQVAALDYMKNIASVLEQPGIIEDRKLVALAKKVVTDHMTGVYDKAVFKDNLEEEIRKAKRYDRPLSILFCDVDDFKTVNDVSGHAAGDSILRRVGEAIRSTIREVDKVYRYGGDEFVCIMPETELGPAMVCAKRINDAVGQIDIETPDRAEGLKLTMSVGVVQFDNRTDSDAWSLLAEADKMMYEANIRGKNRVYMPDAAVNEPLQDKIMVVEDDRVLLEELRDGLSMSGYEIVAVDDGLHAVTLARMHRPRAILLDLKMKDISGFQIADRLKQYPETSRIPVVAMTGYFTKGEDEELAKIFGIKEYFKKPFNYAELSARIGELVASQKPGSL